MAQKFMSIPAADNILEAVQYNGKNADAIAALLSDPPSQMGTLGNGALIVLTHEARFTVVRNGAYVVRWNAGAVEVSDDGSILRGRMPAPDDVITEIDRVVEEKAAQAEIMMGRVGRNG